MQWVGEQDGRRKPILFIRQRLMKTSFLRQQTYITSWIKIKEYLRIRSSPRVRLTKWSLRKKAWNSSSWWMTTMRHSSLQATSKTPKDLRPLACMPTPYPRVWWVRREPLGLYLSRRCNQLWQTSICLSRTSTLSTAAWQSLRPFTRWIGQRETLTWTWSTSTQLA